MPQKHSNEKKKHISYHFRFLEPEIVDKTSEENDNEDDVITDNKNDINVPTIETDEKNVVFKDEGEPKNREKRSLFDQLGGT